MRYIHAKGNINQKGLVFITTKQGRDITEYYLLHHKPDTAKLKILVAFNFGILYWLRACWYTESYLTTPPRSSERLANEIQKRIQASTSKTSCV